MVTMCFRCGHHRQVELGARTPRTHSDQEPGYHAFEINLWPSRLLLVHPLAAHTLRSPIGIQWAFLQSQNLPLSRIRDYAALGVQRERSPPLMMTTGLLGVAFCGQGSQGKHMAEPSLRLFQRETRSNASVTLRDSLPFTRCR